IGTRRWIPRDIRAPAFRARAPCAGCPRAPSSDRRSSSMKVATWNVNSLRVRLPHLLDWLALNTPDAMCLQETKCDDAAFPAEELRAAGYSSVHFGQRAYNGVAILTRASGEAAHRGIPEFPDEQSRVIAMDVDGMRIVSVYVPNGQSVGSDKYEYKLRWL